MISGSALTAGLVVTNLSMSKHCLNRTTGQLLAKDPIRISIHFNHDERTETLVDLRCLSGDPTP